MQKHGSVLQTFRWFVCLTLGISVFNCRVHQECCENIHHTRNNGMFFTYVSFAYFIIANANQVFLYLTYTIYVLSKLLIAFYMKNAKQQSKLANLYLIPYFLCIQTLTLLWVDFLCRKAPRADTVELGNVKLLPQMTFCIEISKKYRKYFLLMLRLSTGVK